MVTLGITLVSLFYEEYFHFGGRFGSFQSQLNLVPRITNTIAKRENWSRGRERKKKSEKSLSKKNFCLARRITVFANRTTEQTAFFFFFQIFSIIEMTAFGSYKVYNVERICFAPIEFRELTPNLEPA